MSHTDPASPPSSPELATEARIDRQGLLVFYLLCAASAFLSLLFYHYTAPLIAIALGVALVLTLLCVSFLLSRPALRRHVLAAGFLWLLLALGGGEAVLSIQEGIWSGYRFSPTLGWGLRPHLDGHILKSASGPYAVTTDALGYRNDFAPKGNEEILLQGDSNALGFGLSQQEHFCAVMQRKHQRSCFNAGITGYDPHHYYIQFQNLSSRFPKARRVVMFTVGNDFATTALASPYAMPRPVVYAGDGGKSPTRIEPAPPVAVPMQIYGHHFLPHLRAFDDGLQTIEPGRDWGHDLPAWLEHVRIPLFFFELVYPRAREAWLRQFDSRQYEHGRRFNPYYPEWKTRAMAQWPEPYQRHLPDFDRLMAVVAGQSKKAPMILALVPMREQVIPARRPDRPDSELLTLHHHLENLGKKHGFVVVDPTALYRSQPDPSLLFQIDHHLSARGMELLVDLVQQAMKGK